MRTPTRRATLGALAAFAAAPHARAQAYPAKPIRILVPYPVGGIVDIVTRALADPMQADLGQPVVVEPKPGANSTLATAMVTQAPADGYTLVMATIAHVVAPLLQAVSYDPIADFQSVALVAVATSVATVNPAVPARTLKELVEYGRANPGKLHYLNPGNGSSIHLSAELLKNRYKFDMVSVPYRGIPPGMTDLLEGRLQVGLLPTTLALQHVQAGKLRALAVLADKRLSTLPDVPTFAEAGFADAQVMSWYVIAVRAGTPAPIVERLHGSAMKALGNAETRDRLIKAGCEVPAPRAPAEVMAMWKADHARYGRLVKEAGIKGES
ncbi:Bug family tripartite tricarboxylate transporter substrate binding protein [Reyranella sp.]|uniref:Bug family tripartite tricarboxylate transporter substrate binding protein n=2 Tax=Reyranella sp. TaxID=1929291 RepID=UPI003D0FF463